MLDTESPASPPTPLIPESAPSIPSTPPPVFDFPGPPSDPVPTPPPTPESPAASTDPGSSTSEPVRRSDRVRQVPAHLRDYHCYATLLSNHEPTSYKEAASCSHWQAAMQEELCALPKAQTWDPIPLPPGKRPIGSKWVFKIKTKSDGSIDRYKARLVAKGFNQEYGIDFEETFAPVARVTSVRSLLAIAATKHWPLFQMDVKNAFLNGDLSEEVYMTPPPGVSLPTGHVCRLRKALYGLKQAPRAWFEKFSKTVLSLGFSASNYDSGLFTRTTDSGSILLLLYVDDMIITGADSTGIASLKQSLSSSFEMKDLGDLHYFLGLEVLSDASGIYLCQVKYVSDLLSKAGFSDNKVASTPLEHNLHLAPNAGAPLQDPTRYRQLVGSLVYLTVTRPDIAYAVHTVSQFMAAPCSDHYAAGFSDADWDSDMTDRRSTTGYCFFLGDSLISWRSKKQSLTARSNTEAEYRALTDSSQELIWLRWLLSDMGVPQLSPTPLWCDNNSAIQITHNDVFHERTKHIEIDCHFIRQHVVRNTIQLHLISTLDQPADIFTKAHFPGRFRELVNKLNLSGLIKMSTVLTNLDMGRMYLSRKEDRDAYILEFMNATVPNPFKDEMHKLKLRVSELEDENKKLNQQVFDIKLGANTMKYDFENQTKLYTLQKKEMEVLKLKLRESEKVEEKQKSLELNNAKLSKKISELDMLLKREKEKNADKDFLINKKFFEIEIRKLTKKLSELLTEAMKEQNMKASLHKKLDATLQERSKLADRDNLSEQEVSSNKSIKSPDHIHSSNLSVDYSSDNQLFKRVKMVWKVKGSTEKVDQAKLFVPKRRVQKNNVFTDKSFGKPDLFYFVPICLNALIKGECLHTGMACKQFSLGPVLKGVGLIFVNQTQIQQENPSPKLKFKEKRKELSLCGSKVEWSSSRSTANHGTKGVKDHYMIHRLVREKKVRISKLFGWKKVTWKSDQIVRRRNKLKVKPNIAPIKLGAPKPKVAFATGVKTNERYVPKKIQPSIDPLDKGKSKLGVDESPDKMTHNVTSNKIPTSVKVSNQFAILEEDEQWVLDKKVIDFFIDKRGIGLEPTVVNSWNRRKLDYFVGQWARVYGKEPDGSLRGFKLPDRVVVSDDDGDASVDESDDDVLSDREVRKLTEMRAEMVPAVGGGERRSRNGRRPMDGRSRLTFISLEHEAMAHYLPPYSSVVAPVNKHIDASKPLYSIQIMTTYVNMQFSHANFLIDIDAPFIWHNCIVQWNIRPDSCPRNTICTSPVSCEEYQCTNVRTSYSYKNPSCPPVNNASTLPGWGYCTCPVTTVNPVTGSCGESMLNYEDFTVNTSNGRNVFPNFYGFYPNAACAPSSSFESFPATVTGVMALSSSPYAMPRYLYDPLKRIIGLCLPSTLSTPGVLFYGNGPYYLLPHSDVDVRSFLSYTSLIKRLDSFGYFIRVYAIVIKNRYIDLLGNITTTKLSTIDPYTTLRSDIYNRVVRRFSKVTKRIPRAKSVEPFGLCFSTFSYGTRVSIKVPDIKLSLQDGKKWIISKANSIKQMTKDVACLAIVDGGPTSEPAIVIGTHQFEDNFLKD
ncbi:hypothetical protein OSB04_031116 [Centaurea solstitialis]|uniref:Reverse transcriptase Ty1/copia-type domain-containing protein n=1 Tax=Centaurea solstitialis TaxID=347529 RepID=A0AA38SGF6_9ASTR|nr:hypothetical protein OSB04_031116 [Centaurea solstitialis]